MLRKLIKISLPIKIVKCIIVVLFFSELNAQFKEANITFDDRLLRDDEKSSLFNLKNSMQKFYVDTVWNDEYRDLELKLNIQVIFEGNANTGSSESFLIQSLFSNNMDLHFFDKGSQFSLSQNSSLYYDKYVEKRSFLKPTLSVNRLIKSNLCSHPLEKFDALARTAILLAFS